jgi:hypothetical protein
MKKRGIDTIWRISDQMCCMEISILLLDNMKEEVRFTIALV